MLVIVPWTEWWRRNLIADLLPWLQPVMASSVTRAGVVLLGVVTLVAGVSEIWQLFFRRSFGRPTPPDFSSPQP